MATKDKDEKSSKGLKLNLLTPDRKAVEGLSILSIILPTLEGDVEILPGYENFVGQIDTGAFTYVSSDGKSVTGFVSTGFYYVTDGVLNVMAETLELSSEISRERAIEAQKRAEKKLSSAEVDFSSFRKYELKLQRALIRQQVATRQ